MIGSVWGLLLVGALLASSAMALMWLIQVRIRDASHVDVAWAVLIACCAIAYALLAEGDTGHRVLAAALASLWGFRLGGYLLFNRVLGKEEDGRYQELRRRWAPNANRNFFVFFQAQALFVVFFSLPFAFISLQAESHPVEFRKVELLNLVGCRDPKAKNYKSYFEKDDPASCRYR